MPLGAAPMSEDVSNDREPGSFEPFDFREGNHPAYSASGLLQRRDHPRHRSPIRRVNHHRWQRRSGHKKVHYILAGARIRPSSGSFGRKDEIMIQTEKVNFSKVLIEPGHHVWCIVEEDELSTRQRFGEESVHFIESPLIIF